MKRWSSRAALLTLVFSMLSSSVGAAPSASKIVPTSPEQVAQAYKHLAVGQKLLASKKYLEARHELELSLNLDPEPITLKDLADCLRGEGRIVDAYNAYEGVLVMAGRPLLPYQRKEVTAALAELGQKTATLTLEIAEVGAAISIDGIALEGLPGAKPIRLEVGAHKVSITKTGFVPFERTLALVGGQTATVSVALAQVVLPITTTEISVKEKSGKEVDVIVDGLVVGKTPWHASFGKGTFHIALVDGGVASESREVTMADGSATLEIVLEAPPIVSTAPEPECKADDDCDDREQCLAGMCKRRPKKSKVAVEGEACAEKPCTADLVCSESVCRKKSDLPFSLRSGLSANWRVAIGLGGESHWVSPVHVLAASLEVPLSRWIRYHLTIGHAWVNRAHAVYLSPLSFGIPIPIELLPASTGVKLYVEPGIDALRAYGAFSSDANDGVFAYALWGRIIAVRNSLFASFTPIEIEQPFLRVTGNGETGFAFKTSGTNYVISLGFGVQL